MKSIHTLSTKFRRGASRAVLSALAAGLLSPPSARAADVISQSGISFTGTVSATPLGDAIAMTSNAAFPGSTTLGNFAFRGAITVGTDLWLLPVDATQIVAVNTATGTMTGYNLIGVGTTQNKFAGGVFDGTFIWLVPFNANGVLRVRVADGGVGESKGDVALFDLFPAGVISTEPGKFAGGVYAGGKVWFVPHNADEVVRLDPADGSMTGFASWPGAYAKGANAFWGGVYDGASIWMVPFSADRVVKVNPADGSMSEVAFSGLTGFTLGSSAFAGGTFDGTRVWLTPYFADRVVSINTASGAMTGYGTVGDATQWPSGFAKGTATFNGSIYDGADVWLVPFEANRLVKVNTTTGAMMAYSSFPSGVVASDIDKFASAGFDGSKIYLTPATLSGQTLVTVAATAAPMVTSITRKLPAAITTNSDALVFQVDFNKNVSGIDVLDFAVVTTGNATGDVSGVTAASGTTVDVAVIGITGDGSLRLDLKATGTNIVDAFSNPITGGFTTGQAFTIDNTPPVIAGGQMGSGIHHNAFSFTPAATGAPTVFSATGLPAGLSIDPATGAISGTPSMVGSTNVQVTATDAAGNSAVATVVISVLPGPRLSNLSARAQVGTGDNVMIPGFVVTGPGTKRVLVRGVGPGLATFGVAGFLAQPTIRLLSGTQELASNTGWGTASNAAEIAQAASTLGAFSLMPNSGDCALLANVPAGSYTVLVSGVNNTTGLSLVEVYDVDAPGAAAKLVNVSARARVGTGAEVLIPGYVIDGNGPRKLLVRAIGPGLQTFGVSGFLADPVITVIQNGVEVAANDNWEQAGNVAAIRTATTQVGALQFADGSKDSAMFVELQPGAYTVTVSGISNTTGVSLVEIYDVE